MVNFVNNSNDNKSFLGGVLLTFAWVLVILAALLALATAWRMVDFYSKNLDEFASFDAIIAGLPFIMVAVLELVKIPLVRCVYFAKRALSRITLSIILLLIALITFETQVLGSERQFNNMSLSAKISEYQLDLTTRDIQFYESQIKVAKLSQDNKKRDELMVTLSDLEQKQLALHKEIQGAYQDKQLHRIAKAWYGIEDGQINNIAIALHGSLTFVVVLLPIFLAFWAYWLKHVVSRKPEVEATK